LLDIRWLIYFVIHILSRISKFALDVVLALLALSELDEEVSEAWVCEITFLGLLAVLVHGVSHHLEVNGCALDHFPDVLFLEMVRKND
jgi:hypothetical protein